jgi:hypothetical protein
VRLGNAASGHSAFPARSTSSERESKPLSRFAAAQRLLPHHREVHLQYPYENIGTREMLSTAAASTPTTNLQNACVTTE